MNKLIYTKDKNVYVVDFEILNIQNHLTECFAFHRTSSPILVDHIEHENRNNYALIIEKGYIYFCIIDKNYENIMLVNNIVTDSTHIIRKLLSVYFYRVTEDY